MGVDFEPSEARRVHHGRHDQVRLSSSLLPMCSPFLPAVQCTQFVRGKSTPHSIFILGDEWRLTWIGGFTRCLSCRYVDDPGVVALVTTQHQHPLLSRPGKVLHVPIVFDLLAHMHSSTIVPLLCLYDIFARPTHLVRRISLT